MSAIWRRRCSGICERLRCGAVVVAEIAVHAYAGRVIAVVKRRSSAGGGRASRVSTKSSYAATTSRPARPGDWIMESESFILFTVLIFSLKGLKPLSAGGRAEPAKIWPYPHRTPRDASRPIHPQIINPDPDYFHVVSGLPFLATPSTLVTPVEHLVRIRGEVGLQSHFTYPALHLCTQVHSLYPSTHQEGRIE